MLIETKPKILIIVGPTSSGKTGLAIRLAKKFNGEIISADSRQVYKGLNIGTGKVTKKEADGIPHHLLDVISPKKVFTVVDFQKQADKKIKEVLDKGKLPIITGGTGFYIQTIVDGIVLPKIAPDLKLRKKLEGMCLTKLQTKLKKLDSAFYKKIDSKNKVRLIRAIEISSKLGRVPSIKKNPKYRVLQIGLRWPKNILAKRIKDRLLARIKQGMISEVRNLHKNGLSWKRMHSLGLEYRHVSLFLQGKISKNEMRDTLNIKINQYAKRQRTWFKRDKEIKWFKPNQYSKIVKEIKKFFLL